MNDAVYQRRTVRNVEAVVHQPDPTMPHGTACGLWKFGYDPAPQVFHRGDGKVEKVTVPCPLCEAALACREIEQKVRSERREGV